MRARADGPHAVRTARLPDPVPQPSSVAGRVPQVDLVADLRAVAGAADHHLHAVDHGVAQVVVRHLGDVVAEQVGDDGLGLRPLDLHRGDVDLADAHVPAAGVGQARRPEPDVGVGEGEPEAVLLDPEQDRVVDDPAVGRGDEHVLALPDRALREVARDEHVGERERVRAGDLDLALDTDVPEGHVLEQRPVLGDGVAVVARVIGVVVDAVHRHAVRPGLPEVGRLPQAGVEQHRRVGDHPRGRRRDVERARVGQDVRHLFRPHFVVRPPAPPLDRLDGVAIHATGCG
ncbi:MAG: hypothetical protein K0S40_2225 [Actinomycetospora sp.]|nr:hypothetical protein [Actinomycetospora sp.]